MPEDNGVLKYLGVGISMERIPSSTYSNLITKVRSRIGGWKTQFLSFAGPCLSQSYVRYAPLHFIANTWVPLKILDDLEKEFKRFLWGKGQRQGATRLVSWKTVTSSKREGRREYGTLSVQHQVLKKKASKVGSAKLTGLKTTHSLRASLESVLLFLCFLRKLDWLNGMEGNKERGIAS